ncbi:phosphoribosyltransferase domain-containing protein [Capnocytophaga sp. ARDL2]|uniref:phosphoribosyltransferase domain-containing protein n=1 Tax=Capnocytophaga sp. ARDL2 TaxID=3238809 RepID=UPI0035580C35
MEKNIILKKENIEFIVRRIAYQIYETFVDENEIVIAGIKNSGFIFANKIAKVLQEISPIEVKMCEVEVNKQKPWEDIRISLSEAEYTDKGIVLVDDVMNSGATLIYGVRHFLNVPIKKFKTAVLIDRNHKKYPVKADFKGISLSTSSMEHIQVVFDKDDEYAYLS